MPDCYTARIIGSAGSVVKGTTTVHQNSERIMNDKEFLKH